MKHKTRNTALTLVAGVAFTITAMLLRGALPELQRYLRIRRM